MRKFIFISIIYFCITAATAGKLYGAVGCTLNDPDRDVKRIFPGSTGYRTEFITIKERGGEELAIEIEKKLGDKLDTVYETIDAPYAYYTVLKGKDPVGYVHGVNQKGTYGGMQLILATDLDGKIVDFYYQKISSPESKKFRDDTFTGQFIGATLADFYSGNIEEKIKDPTENNPGDFKKTIRGLKKNLILIDEFKFNNKFDKDWRVSNEDI